MTDHTEYGKQNTKMIAHRGLSGIERENTAEAFVAAGNRPFFGVECDVHVTKDGKYVVFHDDWTCRICNESLLVERPILPRSARCRSGRAAATGSARCRESLHWTNICTLWHGTAKSLSLN